MKYTEIEKKIKERTRTSKYEYPNPFKTIDKAKNTCYGAKNPSPI